MEPHSLSNLPTELICSILSSASSSDDLLSLILTHSRINECFREAKEGIISAVAHNALESHILADALISFRCINMRRSLGSSSNRNADNHIRTLHRIIGEVNDSFSQSIQLALSESISFLQFQRTVESFIQDYASRHIKKYGGPSLSPVELYRLRRAFYRYDTLQTTNHYTSGMRDPERKAWGWHSVLEEYVSSAWEVEEVVCVHQYLSERLEDVFDRIEEDRIESAITSTQEAARLGGDPDATRWYSEAVARWSRDHPSHFYDTGYEDVNHSYQDSTFFWKSEKRWHGTSIEHILNLGLPFLRNLFSTSDIKSQREPIMENFTSFLFSLPHVLREPANPFKAEMRDLEAGKVLTFEGDSPGKRNLAWLWANQYRPSPHYASQCDADFRSWGYVFWDQARLEEHLKVVSAPCPRVSRDSIPPGQRDRGKEKSVEQRLIELGLIKETPPDQTSYY
jgi:hypothetical protein